MSLTSILSQTHCFTLIFNLLPEGEEGEEAESTNSTLVAPCSPLDELAVATSELPVQPLLSDKKPHGLMETVRLY
jgi:hypothetical protein